MKKILTRIFAIGEDKNFLHLIEKSENIVAKILSIILLAVIFVSLYDLVIVLGQELLFTEANKFFDRSIIKIFGLFLDILIALELLANIAVYLGKHSLQAELVIITSLIAVARKIIIFDFEKYPNSYLHLMALAVAILCLSISYLMVKIMNKEK
ncbi:MAG: phosphate-starvation-inducible PsiE family protein [Xenococcaceae cyanobacterium]